MKKFFLGAFGALLSSMTCAQAQTKNCEVPRFQTADNQVVEGRMIVKIGKTCTVRMGVGVGGFTDAQILREPSRGSVTVRGYDIIYAPKKAFVGADQFTYARNSIDRFGNKALRTVNMSVDVIP